ncbi:ribonuclease VapC [Nocardioides massiliensis]|uniref:Ribonuclease VapC n=2 Tax=Nocardioides massiliensis TaxID=1325935 RepID=A0ABT9NL19_9ACTN|nr:type II toxin-antitoxin system VapC family toxin [Nocardioides massiliensis]MDP9820535.1 ribonuclease VapC [Nocardioides massiliensis]
MIIDSSAIVAIAREESEAVTFTAAIENAADVRISAATLFEVTLVLGPDAHDYVDQFVESGRIEVVAFDARQYHVARRAHAAYGRGSGSPARLNFGDCFAYALAIVSEMPLLFKGQDFVHTDVVPAVAVS